MGRKMRQGAPRQRRIRLLGIPVVVGSLEQMLGRVARERRELSGGYITFLNVHTLMTSREDAAYRAAQSDAAYVMPDGKPIAWLLRRRGQAAAAQIAGPDFLSAALARKDGAGHYFYGGSEETLAALRRVIERDYPDCRIVGMESPPYRVLTTEEEDAAIARMNASGADYIWIGLGAPKQELYMQRMRGRADGIMLGVGAAFDFMAGTVPRAPQWLRILGLEWLYRLLRDPGRLWRRYLVTNTSFILMLPWYLLRARRGGV